MSEKSKEKRTKKKGLDAKAKTFVPRGGKKIVRKQVERKNVKPSSEVIIPMQESLYQTSVKVRPSWNAFVTKEMQAAFTGYLLTKSIIAGASELPITVLYDGILYMFQQFVLQISGTPALDRRIKIIHDLIKAFESKEITKYRYHKVAFSWLATSSPADGYYYTGWNSWNFVVNQPDDETYLSPAVVYAAVPSPSSYNTFLEAVAGISSQRAKFLTLCDSADPSTLSRDASTFAKVYPYLGLNPSKSGGYYNDIENEVDIRAPVLCHNVVYPLTSEDDRVPMKLHVNQGGPAISFAPLLPMYDSWFNKRPLNFKFLDIYEVVNTMIYWYLGACQASLQDSVEYTQLQLPFSLQDFVIVIRQCILSVFKEQWIGQFVGPLAYDGNATNFLPFQILGNCYGNDTFKRLLAPTILAENLSMLQTQVLKNNSTKSQINKTFYVPVWGYYNDIQPVWNIPLPGEPSSVPLFTIPSADQKVIDLVDCNYSGNYINVNNSYYSMVLETWNSKISALKKYVNVCDMSNLSPPSNSVLMQATRVYGYSSLGENKPETRNILPFPCLKPISNLVVKESKDKKDNKDKKITLPAPTDVNKITIQEVLCETPVQKEIHEMFEYMILPSVRFDPVSTNDILNKTMYQTITGEGLSQVQNAFSTAPAYLNRQKDTGDMCVEGLGKITSSSLSVIMRKLCAEGNGGVLASLLGGIAKNIFPNASGIIDTVATALPF
jgi:hypothetical protein